jgi:hypothetical protein
VNQTKTFGRKHDTGSGIDKIQGKMISQTHLGEDTLKSLLVCGNEFKKK